MTCQTLSPFWVVIEVGGATRRQLLEQACLLSEKAEQSSLLSATGRLMTDELTPPQGNRGSGRGRVCLVQRGRRKMCVGSGSWTLAS